MRPARQLALLVVVANCLTMTVDSRGASDNALAAARAIPDAPATPTARAPVRMAASQPNAGCAVSRWPPLPRALGPTAERFEHSAFPYYGDIPGENKKFFDLEAGGRRGHTSPRGSVHWEDQSYSDKHTLLYLPKGLDLAQPGLIVVFFHGNHAMLQRDVVRRQRVPAQLAASGLNAVLVAPQLGYDVADSSAGRFWEPGFFRYYLAEAAAHLARLYGDPCLERRFNELPVVLVAYSGGYNPAAYVLEGDKADHRIRGVILLDALYGETEKFARWLDRRHGSAFFFSAYSPSSEAENLALQHALAADGVPFQVAGGRFALKPGSVVFLPTRPDVKHSDFVTNAWAPAPLVAVLLGIEGYRSASGHPAARAARRIDLDDRPRPQRPYSRQEGR